jgi:anti-sigma regulatory factor (Ser/Thr protein kinase)
MLRREMTGMAKDCGMDSEGIADVRLAVTEAATNAVIHAYAKAEGELRGHRRDARRRARDRHRRPAGPGLVERRDSPGLGVGLSVIASVAERLKFVSHPGGTEIHVADHQRPSVGRRGPARVSGG